MIYDIKGKLRNNYKLLRLTGQNKHGVVNYPDTVKIIYQRIEQNFINKL